MAKAQKTIINVIAVLAGLATIVMAIVTLSRPQTDGSASAEQQVVVEGDKNLEGGNVISVSEGQNTFVDEGQITSVGEGQITSDNDGTVNAGNEGQSVVGNGNQTFNVGGNLNMGLESEEATYTTDEAIVRSAELIADHAYEDAERLLTKALQETDLENAVAASLYYNRALSNIGLGSTKMARHDIEKSIQWYPRPDAYYNLGLLYLQDGAYEDARNAFVTAKFYADNEKYELAHQKAEELEKEAAST